MGNRFLDFTRTLDGDELARMLPELTGKMGEEQVQILLRRLEEELDPGPSRRLAESELVKRWAQLNPEAVLIHIDNLDDPKGRHDLKRRAVEGWASRDPDGAVAFLSEADDLPKDVMLSFWTGLATTSDLYCAFEFIPRLQTGELDSLPGGVWNVTQAVQGLYHNDDQAVIAWVEDLPEGGVRDGAVLGVVEEWARHAPQHAIAWIEKHVDPENTDAAYERLLRSWRQHDPGGAAEWSSSRPPSPPVPVEIPPSGVLE